MAQWRRQDSRPAREDYRQRGSGKIATISNTLTFTGTDGSSARAGTVLYNGGALGSPSSAGTLPAHTPGGTVSGGGNPSLAAVKCFE